MKIQAVFYPFRKEAQKDNINARLLIVISEVEVEMPGFETMIRIDSAMEAAQALADDGHVILLERQWYPGIGNRWTVKATSRDLTHDYGAWLGRAVRQVVFGKVAPGAAIAPPYELYYQTLSSSGTVLESKRIIATAAKEGSNA